MPVFLAAAITFGADPEVNFVPANRVSVRELRVPDKARNKYADGQARVTKHDVSGARRKFTEAVEIAPEYAAAWNALGVLATDPAQAEPFFRQAIAADADNVEALLNLGALLLKTGRAEQALELHRRAAKLVPEDAAALAQFGINLYQLGDLNEAERALLTATRINPQHAARPQLFLAEIYARRGEKARAAAQIEELLALKPNPELATTLRSVLAKLQ
ncbi:MAG: tetratricopeptide repeat protein [Acidobacteriota bacterium]